MSSTVERSGEDPTSPEDASGASEAAAEGPGAGENGDATDAASDDAATIHDSAPSEVDRAETAGIEVEIELDDEDEAEEQDPAAATAALINDLEAKVRDHYQRLVRTSADFENFRKRSRREINEARVDGQSRVLREMLPVVDNLERALAATSDAPELASIRQGVELVLRQFSQALEKFEVRRIVAKGAAFDPNLHEAVSQVPSAELPPGTVVEVLQPGYVIGERLLRAALTVVSMAAPEPTPEAAPAEAIESAADVTTPIDTDAQDAVEAAAAAIDEALDAMEVPDAGGEEPAPAGEVIELVADAEDED